MTQRKIGEILGGETGKNAYLYFNSEFDEYTVCFYKQGVYQPNADYFTGDREDAFDTAHNWAHKKD